MIDMSKEIANNNEVKEIIDIDGVECYEKDGVVYLKLKAVARGLGLTRIANSGNEVVRWERVERYLREFGFVPTNGHEGFIPENIFYRLAMRTNNSVAVAFQAKVADEIIPIIRKHGAYMTPETIERALYNPDFLIKIATELKEEQQRRMALQHKVEKDKPKVQLAEAITDSKSTIYIGDLAKILRQNGIDIGQNRLFTWLREHGYLMRRVDKNYMPTQKAMDLKLFTITETTAKNKYGDSVIHTLIKVTGKGQQYFVDVFLKEILGIK